MFKIIFPVQSVFIFLCLAVLLNEDTDRCSSWKQNDRGATTGSRTRLTPSPSLDILRVPPPLATVGKFCLYSSKWALFLRRCNAYRPNWTRPPLRHSPPPGYLGPSALQNRTIADDADRRPRFPLSPPPSSPPTSAGSPFPLPTTCRFDPPSPS